MGNFNPVPLVLDMRTSPEIFHEPDDPSKPVFTAHSADSIETPILSTTFRSNAYSRLYAPWFRLKATHGWRVGVAVVFYSSALVLICNLALLIAGAVAGYRHGTAQLITGSASKISKYNTGYHILINILSTILLSASNYTMQVLNAPTRNEVDWAHARGYWADIGVMSFRNLRILSRKKILLWLMLGFSSAPLHLFYNSAVFPALSQGRFRVSLYREDSLSHRDLQQAANTPEAWRGALYSIQNTTTWSHTHSESYSSSYGDLYLIYDQVAFSSKLSTLRSTNASAIEDLMFNATMQVDNPDFWSTMNMSGFLPTAGGLGKVESNWLTALDFSAGLSSVHISHAYTQDRPVETSLQMSLVFMIIVVVFNAGKVAVMYFVLKQSDGEELITLGDAISSYLRNPEPGTEGYCTLSKQEFLFKLGLLDPTAHEKDQLQRSGFLRGEWGAWRTSRKRLISSLSSKRSIFAAFLSCVTVAAIVYLVARYQSASSGGWGSSSQAIVPFSRTSFNTSSTISNALLANVPQLLLSMSYFFLNGICTAMATAREWTSLAHYRKGLRVSKPSGAQRETYFLSLPYKFGMPLAAMSGLMHWLLSQSFFLVRQEYKDEFGDLEYGLSKSACGISLLSLIIFLAVYLLSLLILACFALLKIENRIPFAASCSLVYSAACHPPDDDLGAHLKPVQWGVIQDEAQDGRAQHCTITSQAVTAPTPGTIYI